VCVCARVDISKTCRQVFAARSAFFPARIRHYSRSAVGLKKHLPARRLLDHCTWGQPLYLHDTRQLLCVCVCVCVCVCTVSALGYWQNWNLMIRLMYLSL